MAGYKQGLPGGSVGRAVTLSMPELHPAPVEGCEICGEQAVLRSAAFKRGDHSAVSDSNVRIRSHQHHRNTR
ncbi:hypothetical protein [Streptomyces erythrochromogenes]|uniref:hypothetical protein n=1 Tax=Streptomyces erythrochromogenes TaxID=285574 RepID=UPI00380F5904